MTFEQFIAKEMYVKVRGLGDRLALMKEQIDWKPFIPLVKSVYNDDTAVGGRPHTDDLVIVRSMLLQAWYGLSDPELEFQCHDRLSFRNFLGFPETVPDFSTIWKARDRLKEAGVDEQVWAELQRQLSKKGYEIKKGVIQDASFIEADLGKKRYYKEKKAKKEGEEITYTEKQQQHIDRDGSFSIKHGQVHYGYKRQIKIDVKHQLIRKYEVSTASLHDSQISLVNGKDGKAYHDKGYVGTTLPRNVIDKTMHRPGRGHKLTRTQQEHNKKISSVRAPGERPFSVITRIFHNTRTLTKTISRIKIKELFVCFAYNLYQLVTLTRKQLAKTP